MGLISPITFLRGCMMRCKCLLFRGCALISFNSAIERHLYFCSLVAEPCSCGEEKSCTAGDIDSRQFLTSHLSEAHYWGHYAVSFCSTFVFGLPPLVGFQAPLCSRLGLHINIASCTEHTPKVLMFF